MKSLEKAVDTGNEEVIIGKSEKVLNDVLLKEFNKKKKTNLKLSRERRDIQGGFILRHGKIETDASLDTFVEIHRKELEMFLAKELFE